MAFQDSGSGSLPKRGKALLIFLLLCLAIAGARLVWVGVSAAMFIGLMAFYVVLFLVMFVVERRSRG